MQRWFKVVVYCLEWRGGSTGCLLNGIADGGFLEIEGVRARAFDFVA